MRSLTFLYFSFNQFYTDCAYYEKNNHIKIFCSEMWAEMIFGCATF
jgi:hypothetical protein